MSSLEVVAKPGSSSFVTKAESASAVEEAPPPAITLQMGWKPNYTHTNSLSLRKLILSTPLQTNTITNQSNPTISTHNIINYQPNYGYNPTKITFSKKKFIVQILPHRFAQSSCQLYRVISNKFQSISIKFYSMNARFYFQSPVLDVGPTYNSSHAALDIVAPSHTESSPSNFNQFR